MIAFKQGRLLASDLSLDAPADLKPVLSRFGIEIVPWRFSGRVREVIIEGTIGIDDRLSAPWTRWLTAHALGHHLLHTGTSLYLESWQWVSRVKAERQAEEFAAGLLTPGDASRVRGYKGLARFCGIPESKALLLFELLGRP